MATYYVSATTGNDSNNGTTIALAKATIGAGEDLATSAGDIVYIAPGTYRETITHGYSGTQANRIYFIGDPDCEIFGDAVPPGIVRVTKTDANNLPDTGATLFTVIYSGGKDYITWKNIYVDGGGYPVTSQTDSNTTYGIRAQYESDRMEVINCMIQGVFYGTYRVGYVRSCAAFCHFGGFREGYLIENSVASSYYGFYIPTLVRNCVAIGGNYGFLYCDEVQNSTAYGSYISFRTNSGDVAQECVSFMSGYAFYGGTNATNAANNGIISSSYFNGSYYSTNYGFLHGIKGCNTRYPWVSGRDPLVGKNGDTNMAGNNEFWELAPLTLHSFNDLMTAAKLLGKPSVLSDVLQGSTTTNFDDKAGATDFEGNPRIMGSLKGIFAEGASGLTTSSRDLGAFELVNVEVTSSISSSMPGFSITDEGIFRIPITVSASSAVTASIGLKHNKGVGTAVKPQFQLRFSETDITASNTSTYTSTAANTYLSGSGLIIQSNTSTAADNVFETITVSGSFDKSHELELLFINQQTGSDSISTFSDLEIT